MENRTPISHPASSRCDKNEINTQTKHCSAKREKVKISNGQWQWAGCIMADKNVLSFISLCV